MPFKNPHPLYSVWQGMKRRCDNPNFKQFSHYGGRGIYVCERWINSFENFVYDMGERPEGYSIERVDNDGPYSPENCVWASRSEQQRNRRITTMVTIEGIEYVAVSLAQKAGLKTDTIVQRAALGLTFDEVMSPKRRSVEHAYRSAIAARIAKQRAATHCANGHPWNEENTRLTPEGWRSCRACAREKMRRRTAAKKVAAT